MGLDDRYSIAYKYLPFLLAGCADEMPHLSQLSWDAVDAAGKLYEAEWPDRVKNELDLVPLSGELNGEKARVGVRHLFRDNTQKIAKSLMDGAMDWNAEKRLVSTRCLALLVGFVRGYITGYLNGILDAVCRICAAADEVRIVDAVSFWI
jgi:dynein assembly factor 5